MASAEKIAAGYRKLVDEKQVLPWRLPMSKVNVQLQDQALAGKSPMTSVHQFYLIWSSIRPHLGRSGRPSRWTEFRR